MSKEFVILLHGILRNKIDMLPLSRYLEKRGYGVFNILYPSRKQSIEQLVEYVDNKLKNCPEYHPEMTMHFVTHSMGGLIARYYIAQKKPPNLGKVVMLSPPNTGSDTADFLNNHKVFASAYRALFGPASQQMVTTYAHKDGGDITYPLGIIAGTRSINPLALWMMPRSRVGAHDGIVPVERTKIKGMTAHITMPSTHSFMMFNPKVMEQVAYFLENETIDGVASQQSG